jgi:hypothetical protein
MVLWDISKRRDTLSYPLHSITSQRTRIIEAYVSFAHVLCVHYIFSCNYPNLCMEGNYVFNHVAVRLRSNNRHANVSVVISLVKNLKWFP